MEGLEKEDVGPGGTAEVATGRDGLCAGRWVATDK